MYADKPGEHAALCPSDWFRVSFLASQTDKAPPKRGSLPNDGMYLNAMSLYGGLSDSGRAYFNYSLVGYHNEVAGSLPEFLGIGDFE